MGSYKVIISPHALSQLNEYIDYIQNNLQSAKSAKNVWEDAIETRNKLSEAASSLKLCENPKLQKYGYRKINFLYHRYVMIYRVEGNTVYVDGIYHQLQDYENTFSSEVLDV